MVVVTVALAERPHLHTPISDPPSFTCVTTCFPVCRRPGRGGCGDRHGSQHLQHAAVAHGHHQAAGARACVGSVNKSIRLCVDRPETPCVTTLQPILTPDPSHTLLIPFLPPVCLCRRCRMNPARSPSRRRSTSSTKRPRARRSSRSRSRTLYGR